VDTTPVHCLSLCSGGGGLDLGVRLAIPHARTVCYVEREAFACEVLVQAMQAGHLDKAPIWTDLTTFDGKPWRGKVDFIFGGYPCQPFSVAGKRQGESDERWLWPDIVRIIREIRPRFCFFENVPGHLRLGFDRVLCDLAEIGFDVEWTTLSAAECGASHKRERLWILARSRCLREEGPQHQPWSSGIKAYVGGNGEGLGNTSSVQFQGFPSTRPGEIGHRSEELGDSNSDESREMQSVDLGGRSEIPGDGREKLADSALELHDGTGNSGKGWRGEYPDGSEELVDTGHTTGSAELGEQPEEWAKEPWPPGPNDNDAWEWVYRNHPGLAPLPALSEYDLWVQVVRDLGVGKDWGKGKRPSKNERKAIKSRVRGMAHGVALRMDQLRMLGNGVVPVVASVVLMELMKRAEMIKKTDMVTA